VHRLRSKAIIRRFRLAAFLLWFGHLMVLVTVFFCIHLVFSNEPQHLVVGLGLLLFLPVLTIFRWIISSRTNCPLCLTPVLGGKNCSKHRRARTLLGSYKIVVANSILTKNSFCCPYCYEPTVLEVRQNPRDLADKHGADKE